jgi:hypothetical protein
MSKQVITTDADSSAFEAAKKMSEKKWLVLSYIDLMFL